LLFTFGKGGKKKEKGKNERGEGEENGEDAWKEREREKEKNPGRGDRCRLATCMIRHDENDPSLIKRVLWYTPMPHPPFFGCSCCQRERERMREEEKERDRDVVYTVCFLLPSIQTDLACFKVQ
jgi:hypothetical protein